MKDKTISPATLLIHDLWMSLLLLTFSILGGWLSLRAMSIIGDDRVHLRLLIILLVHPFAMAAWVFCGLPGFGLAVQSLFRAIEQRRPLVGMASAGLLGLSLVCVSFWA